MGGGTLAGVTLADSRNTTYAAADPVLSNDLNELQDAVIQAAHGEVVDIVNAQAMRLGTNVAMAGGGWAEWTGAGTANWGPQLRTGQRVTRLTLRVYGNGAADFTVGVYVVSPTAGLTQICPGGVTAAITNPAASWADAPINLTDTTLAAGECLLIEIAGSAANLRVLNAQLTTKKPLT